MTTTKRTATEVTATSALAVAAGLAFSGAYIPAGIAALIGVVCFIAYERLNVQGVQLSEEEIEQISERAGEEIEKLDGGR